MDFSGKLVPNDAVGYFCVASQSARHPVQPVTPGPFFIGRGKQCHLRLGHDGIPEVQCVVSVSSQTAFLECRSDCPPVIVNGTETRATELQDGDLVEVGEYRLLFRRLAEGSRITLDELNFNAQSPAAADNTATELVDLLQQQLQLVGDCERSTQSAVRELLAAASAVGQSPAGATPKPAADQLTAVEALQQVTHVITQQQEVSRLRMESVTEVLNNVVRQQQAVADALQLLSQRVLAMEAGRDFVPRRASA